MARLILLLLFVLVSVSFVNAAIADCYIRVKKTTSRENDGTESTSYSLEWGCDGRRRRDTGEIGTPTDTNMRTNFFHIIDLNNDGLLDRAEWAVEGGEQYGFTAILENYDANGDQMISLEEFHTIHLDPSVSLFVEDFQGDEDEVGWENL